MVRSLLILSLALVGDAAEPSTTTSNGRTTCGNMKESYRVADCCGEPAKEVDVQIVPDPKMRLPLGTNPCAGKKPKAGGGFDNFDCVVNEVLTNIEQSGGDVSAGFVGGLNASDVTPLTVSYFKKGLCPVNVHWHLGAEHRSQGQYDESGKGPLKAGTPTTVSHATHEGGRRLGTDVRYGFACHHYDANDVKFTKAYDWQHCVGMHVGETYEVHWPHSALGDCNTPWQFQYPFYDGVLCHLTDAILAAVTANGQVLVDAVGVQAQVFTIVNDENYYYPDLMRGALISGDFWKDVVAYTGSTTGTTRNNKICSKYSPITWQVDRKCHLISASSFDKMCADMKQQADDMSKDLMAHGARELVWKNLTADNQQAYTR